MAARERERVAASAAERRKCVCERCHMQLLFQPIYIYIYTHFQGFKARIARAPSGQHTENLLLLLLLLGGSLTPLFIVVNRMHEILIKTHAHSLVHSQKRVGVAQ
jgi:hypothetical protein